MGTTEGLQNGIVFPDLGTNLTPLETHFSNLAESAQQEINFVAQGTPIPVSSDVERNTLFPAPVGMESVTRRDKGWVETYYPASLLTKGQAGWYPVSGRLPTWRSNPTGTAPLNNGSWSVVGFNAGVDINHGGLQVSGNSLLVPYAGIYDVHWGATFSANAGGSARGLALTIDGDSTNNRQGSEFGVRQSPYPNAAITMHTHWSGPVTTSIVFMGYQNAASGLTLDNRFMFVRYVGPV